MSARRNRDSPNPSLASECAPLPGTKGGRTLASGWGVGGVPIPTTVEKSLALCLLCDKALILKDSYLFHFHLCKIGKHLAHLLRINAISFRWPGSWVFHTQVRKIFEWNKRLMSTALFWIHWAPQRPLYWEFLYLQDFQATLLSGGFWFCCTCFNFDFWGPGPPERNLYLFTQRRELQLNQREGKKDCIKNNYVTDCTVYVRVSQVSDKHMPEIPLQVNFLDDNSLLNSYLVNGWTPPTSGIRLGKSYRSFRP